MKFNLKCVKNQYSNSKFYFFYQKKFYQKNKVILCFLIKKLMKISVNLAQFFVVLALAICLIPAVVILGIILALKKFLFLGYYQSILNEIEWNLTNIIYSFFKVILVILSIVVILLGKNTLEN